MISEKTIIRISNSSIKKYRNLGFLDIKQGDYIEVPTYTLDAKSNFLVECQCENTECMNINILKIPYIQYSRSKEKHGIYLCKKCSYKKTCIKKYGVEHSSKSPIITKKFIETNKKRFGLEYPVLLEKTQKAVKKYNKLHKNEITEKKKRTLMEKYNVENVFQLEEVKNKSRKTCQKKFGADFYVQTDEFKKKIKEICLMKYGTESSNQNKKIHDKQVMSGRKINHYRCASSHFNGIRFQGSYEKDFILLCENNNILIKRFSHGIKYFIKDEQKIYFPDFFLPEKNLIIEIKSKYYYEKELEKNLKKEKACLKDGYNFLFILDKNYTKFFKIIS